ncbi:MAG: hypothetical protein K2O10_02645, partial [Muribaculaceae bacterium]|nr:hypothetical protein [Muribaculaceae bacterium]
MARVRLEAYLCGIRRGGCAGSLSRINLILTVMAVVVAAAMAACSRPATRLDTRVDEIERIMAADAD